MSASASPPPPPEWLLLGAETAGKTCIARALKQACSGRAEDTPLSTEPTNGVERDSLVFPVSGGSCVLQEVGGSMKTTWASYFAHCAGVIFVIDVSDATRLSSALFELMSLLTHATLADRPFLLLLNKVDAPAASNRSELQATIRLDDIIAAVTDGADDGRATRRMHVVETSASKGIGIEEVLQLMREIPVASERRAN